MYVTVNKIFGGAFAKVDDVDRRKLEELYREAVEENHDFTLDELVERMVRAMSRGGEPFDPDTVKSLVERLHEERTHGHPLDYDDISEQSFPASDPPPVP